MEIWVFPSRISLFSASSVLRQRQSVANPARRVFDGRPPCGLLESFAQPLEVKEPLELLRAGMVFHARGLLNTGAMDDEG